MTTKPDHITAKEFNDVRRERDELRAAYQEQVEHNRFAASKHSEHIHELSDRLNELRAENERLRTAFDILDKRHASLLDDIERWNATIAAGRDRADQMEDVIRAARNLDNHRDEGYATLVSYLIRLHEALATYEANKTPLPEQF